MRNQIRFEMVPGKGSFRDNLTYISLEAVNDCRGRNCKAFTACTYSKSGKCSVQQKYLTEVVDSIVVCCDGVLNQEILNKITLHLIPLFHQLCIFQIEAYGVDEPFYETSKGLIKPHPVFKEIRDTIRSIEMTQKSLGIDNEFLRAMGSFAPGLRGRNTVDRLGTAESGEMDFRREWDKSSFGQNIGLKEENGKGSNGGVTRRKRRVVR